jgi:Flp pilus assembly protein TadG
MTRKANQRLSFRPKRSIIETLRRGKTRYRSENSGVSAVEFALIAAVLVTLMIGIVELTLVVYTYTQAGNATRDVARRIASGRLTTTGASEAVKAQLPQWVRDSASVTATQTTPATPATNQITVSVSFPAAKATPTTFLSFAYGSSTLTRTLTMAQQI